MSLSSKQNLLLCSLGLYLITTLISIVDCLSLPLLLSMAFNGLVVVSSGSNFGNVVGGGGGGVSVSSMGSGIDSSVTPGPSHHDSVLPSNMNLNLHNINNLNVNNQLSSGNSNHGHGISLSHGLRLGSGSSNSIGGSNTLLGVPTSVGANPMSGTLNTGIIQGITGNSPVTVNTLLNPGILQSGNNFNMNNSLLVPSNAGANSNLDLLVNAMLNSNTTSGNNAGMSVVGGGGAPGAVGNTGNSNNVINGVVGSSSGVGSTITAGGISGSGLPVAILQSSNNLGSGNTGLGTLSGTVVSSPNHLSTGGTATGIISTATGNVLISTSPRDKIYEKCTGPPDPGPCKQYTYKWRYELTTGECTSFIWGGCDGNVNNRFNSEAECLYHCIGAPRK